MVAEIRAPSTVLARTFWYENKTFSIDLHAFYRLLLPRSSRTETSIVEKGYRGTELIPRLGLLWRWQRPLRLVGPTTVIANHASKGTYRDLLGFKGP